MSPHARFCRVEWLNSTPYVSIAQKYRNLHSNSSSRVSSTARARAICIKSAYHLIKLSATTYASIGMATANVLFTLVLWQMKLLEVINWSEVSIVNWRRFRFKPRIQISGLSGEVSIQMRRVKRWAKKLPFRLFKRVVNSIYRRLWFQKNKQIFCLI